MTKLDVVLIENLLPETASFKEMAIIQEIKNFIRREHSFTRMTLNCRNYLFNRFYLLNSYNAFTPEYRDLFVRIYGDKISIGDV